MPTIFGSPNLVRSQEAEAGCTYAAGAADTDTVGALMMWDSTNKKAVQMTAKTDGPNFIGVNQGQIPIASNIDNATGLENSLLIKGKDVFLFNTTAGDTYNHGESVNMGADAFTIKKLGGDAANQVVGFVFTPTTKDLAGGAGVQVAIAIRRNYPAAL